MKSILSAAAITLLAAACSDSGNPTNPTRLWLALDGSEQQVRLVNVEPAPY